MYFLLLLLDLSGGCGGLFPCISIYRGLEYKIPLGVLKPFSSRTTIGFLLIISCDLIDAALCYDISFMYSYLASTETWMEVTHSWVLVGN